MRNTEVFFEAFFEKIAAGVAAHIATAGTNMAPSAWKPPVAPPKPVTPKPGFLATHGSDLGKAALITGAIGAGGLYAAKKAKDAVFD